MASWSHAVISLAFKILAICVARSIALSFQKKGMHFNAVTRIFFFLVICAVAGQSHTFAQQTGREYYELKIFDFSTADQEALTDDYLKQALLPALKRYGIGPVGVFKSREALAGKGQRRTYVVIPFQSLIQFGLLEPTLAGDPDFTDAGSAFINAPFDRPPYDRTESVLLHAFEQRPQMQVSTIGGPRSDRIYELRSYESPTQAMHQNKLDMFNIGKEADIFDRLGFHPVFYGAVVSGNRMPNLMYLTTFKNQEDRDVHWDTFRADPQWNRLEGLPEYQNNVSGGEKLFLYPTEYSDY